ncbi:MAG: autotransporter assembly complex protein TamA [Formosimonas sp.]
MTVDAPKEVKKILTDYLDIVRYQKRDDIKDEYLDYLRDTTPEQVASLLSTQGYFDARTEIIDNATTGLPDLTVKVTLGERTMVKTAKLDVVGLVKEQDPKRVGELEFDWSLQEDEPFTQDEWSLAKTLLLRKIQADAYASAKFDSTQALVVPEKKSVDLTATLDSGPYFTLGEVEAAGLRRYPASVIQNMNVIEVGEAYNRKKLLDYQKRLQNLPYFSSVVVDISNDRKDAQLAPIKVQVVELPTQSFKGLAGYGTDAGYRANVQYAHYNVFKKGWILDSKVDWQHVDREARVSLTTPQNKDHYQWSVVSKLEQTRNSPTNLDEDNGQVGLHYARKLEHTALSYDVDFYLNRNRNLSTKYSFNSHALFAGVTWAKNQVDNPAFPRKGYALEASVGAAVRGLASSASFIRAYGRLRYFIPFKKEDSLLLRTELGAVLTRDSLLDVPTPLLFLAGGSSSLRGYAYQSIGDASNEQTESAKYLWTASAEYTHWFNKSWGVAVFYDVGTATNQLSRTSIYHGAGVGARWRSPVGPIHFDLAYGYPRKKISPHISIGILF